MSAAREATRMLGTVGGILLLMLAVVSALLGMGYLIFNAFGTVSLIIYIVLAVVGALWIELYVLIRMHGYD